MVGPAGRLPVILTLLLFGPGYLIERALLPIAWPALFLRPALWLGLSLSAVALLYEWATALGLALSPPALYALAGACGLAVVWRLWTKDGRPKTKDQTPSTDSSEAAWSFVLRPWSWALLGVFALTLATRFVQIRNLALPAWVDPVHHALMIRVAAERGQAPLSLEPYLPIAQIPYHWGYQVLLAAALRLSGAALPQTMLWAGQALNALHVLTVAALAAYLWRRPAAGVAAGVVVGLLSIFPAYYVSWGRYTQLTGLLLLPPLIIAWLELLRAPSRRLVAVLALLLAGLSMIHFVVLVFALCFMAVSGAIWAIGVRREDLWARLWRGAIGGALALALAGPWLWVLAARQLRPTAAGRGQPLAGGGIYNALDPGLLWAGHNRILIALALLAALWSVLRRWRPAAEQAGWAAALVVFANPWIALYLLPAGGATLLLWSAQRRRWLLGLAGAALLLLNPALVHLPYLALITNEAVVISLFIPIGVLIGGGAGFVWQATNVQTFKRSNVRTFAYWSLVIGRWSLARTACAAALAGAALWGAWDMRDVVNPSTVLATPADVAAIEWAAQHTPTNARFLINAAPWLVTGRGDDGGWWLLPLADRWTSTPPVIYDYGPLDYVRETQARTRQVIDFRPGREQQIYGLIDRERITYVYLGPNGTPLTPGVFPASQGFEKVYDRDGATIFAVHRP